MRNGLYTQNLILWILLFVCTIGRTLPSQGSQGMHLLVLNKSKDTAMGVAKHIYNKCPQLANCLIWNRAYTARGCKLNKNHDINIDSVNK